jgi:hypothetical protein
MMFVEQQEPLEYKARDQCPCEPRIDGEIKGSQLFLFVGNLTISMQSKHALR